MYGQTQKITGVFFKLRRPAFPWGPLKLRTSSPINCGSCYYKHQSIGLGPVPIAIMPMKNINAAGIDNNPMTSRALDAFL